MGNPITNPWVIQKNSIEKTARCKYGYKLTNMQIPSRGLVWFNISQDNAGGWRNEEITNAIKVPNNHAIFIPLWDDCYGDHCGTLMKLNISCSPRLKVVALSKWSPTRRSWSTGWRSRAGVRRRRCSVIMLSQVVMRTIGYHNHHHHQDLFLHIALFSLRLCYSLRRRCRSSPLLWGLCCSEAAG